MFKIAKKNLILMKIDALFKHNLTCLWSFTILFWVFRTFIKDYYNNSNFKKNIKILEKNIKIFEKNMFKIVKKNLILVKIDALFKNNPTCLWSFTIFFWVFQTFIKDFYINLNFKKNIKIFEKNMFKIAKKIFILVKIDAFYKKNSTCLLSFTIFFWVFRTFIKDFYNNLNFKKNIKILEKNMFKIAKKNLILVKIDALFKNNFTCLLSFTIFFWVFRTFIKDFYNNLNFKKNIKIFEK